MTKQEIDKLFAEPKRLFCACKLLQIMLVKRGVGPSWKRFTETEDWKLIAPHMSELQRDRFELEWRRCLSQ